MSKLVEGLTRHALEHLVVPMVSIDEYESKIDDRRVIVVGFYVKDQDPARDLSQFIEKSSIRPLDTEVSPAPTDDGYYLVFVEMGRNDEFPKRLVSMTKQLNNLCNTEKWSFKPYGSGKDGVYDLNLDNLREYVNLDPRKVEIEDEPDTDEVKPAEIQEPAPKPSAQPSPQDQKAAKPAVQPAAAPAATAESIGKFFANSLVENVEVRGEWLRITDRDQQRVYKITSYKSGVHARMPVFGLDIGSPVLRESIALQKMLGTGYWVDCADAHVTITDGDNHLILAVDA